MLLRSVVFTCGGVYVVFRTPVNLAYYSSGRLHAVGRGLDRGVYALTLAHNCLYVGGAFHQYAVRICTTGERVADVVLCWRFCNFSFR
jgi:hypothetical protein